MIKATEHNSSFTLLPEKKFAGFEGPPADVPPLRQPRAGVDPRLQRRPAGHVELRLRRPAGRVAAPGQRRHAVRPLEYDPLACKIPNHAEADAALSPPHRKGWSL